jgi:acyl carrier protein
MSVASPEQVKGFLKDFLSQRLKVQGRPFPQQLSDDCDLLASGLLDSLGLLELVSALSRYCGREIDFEELDPDMIAVVGPLCRFVSTQCSGS